MVQYVVTYSIQDGKERQHDEWWQSVGQKFWQKQEGFTELRRYSTLVGGGPDILVEIDFASGSNVVEALGSHEAKTILEDFEHMVESLSTKIAIPMA